MRSTIGLVTPESDEGVGIASADAPETHDNEHRDSVDHRSEGKAFSTLRAQLALNGYTLTRAFGDDGSARYFVGRWGLCRELANIAAVLAFAEHAGVRHA